MAGEEDSTAAVAEDFMEAEERFTGVEVSQEEVALGSWADARSADLMAAASEDFVGADSVGAVALAVAAGASAGAGDLASGGHIGVGDGDIRMATTAPGTTGLALIIRIRITDLRTTLRAIPIRATGTMILRRQIQTRGPCPTRTDRQDLGDHRYREAERIQTTETATPWRLRRVGRLYLLTG